MYQQRNTIFLPDQRWEENKISTKKAIKKTRKKERKQELDQENAQEKKKVSFFLRRFLGREQV